ESLKIIVPMAGFGTRLRPHTWSRPKPLLSAAGDTVLGHVLKLLRTAPGAEQAEFIFIVGYLGDQVQRYMLAEHPQVKTHFVQQAELLGQSHALAQAREYLHGPTIVIFVDTVVETDFSGLDQEEADAVAWVKPVEDPRRFGVAAVGKDGWVTGLIEKPGDLSNNLAVVGIYYFKRGEELLAAIDEQMKTGVVTKNEFFLADAIDIMLKRGLKMRIRLVEEWLDAGLPESVLETNRRLLDKGRDNSAESSQRAGVTIKPPVFIHPSATLEASTLGPYVSIGQDCVVRNSTIEDAILESGVLVENSSLRHSMLGERSQVRGVTGQVNIGDDSQINEIVG
ncbi:MAG: sugar phosphate nucleotidyltransferase, partial [Anaerolineales bacterium]